MLRMQKEKDKIIALAGNPNSGKTTLFNALTGSNQTIGNWPGVTVEKKTGLLQKSDIKIVDLPGIYSLTAYSIDEEIASNYIIHESPDLIVNIVDVTNLERNLYLTTQLLQFRKPMIVCLNMMDILDKIGIKIDIQLLEEFLGCLVIPISALKKTGLEEIKSHINIAISQRANYISQTKIPYDEVVITEIENLLPDIQKKAEMMSLDPYWFALKMIENETFILQMLSESEKEKVEQAKKRIHRHTKMQIGILIADGRYSFIKGICREIFHKKASPNASFQPVHSKITFSDKIDKFLLHPLVGTPFFVFVMYLMFMFSITLSKPFIEIFDTFFGNILIDRFGEVLDYINLPTFFKIFFADGIGGGLTTVSTFIPPIFFVFLFLSFLEDSGYMARATFIMDKFMHWLGLSGKSIIPLVIGFGCTVPAIMATRTLENKRDRLMTIMLTPFMSCGAKIPVYVMFALLFFPENAGLGIFSLYFTGFLLALLTGQILKRFVFKGLPSEYVMELPAYHLPTLNGILMHTWHKLKSFITRAGKTILCVMILLTMINSLPLKTNSETGETETILTIVGKSITPVFRPMGIEKDNWQATVSLIVGLFAKEAIVGSFEVLYDNVESIVPIDIDVENLFILTEDSTSPPPKILGGNFKNIHQVIAYLLFVLIYTPCVAAIAVVYKEAGRKLATMQLIYLTLLAWVVATLYYNIAVFTLLSLLWFAVAGFIFAGLLLMFDKIKFNVQT